MISRRQLIGSGVAISVLGLGVRVSSAFEPSTRRVAHLVVDTRFDDAHEIAHQAATPGLDILELPRDVLELWYDRLLPAHQSSPRAFAGVTTEQGFFMLRTLAADQRLRVQFAASHATPRGGRIAHELSGPAGLLTRCRVLSGSTPWQSVIGAAIRSCPAGRPTQARFASLSRAARRDEVLVSWVIGPAASRT